MDYTNVYKFIIRVTEFSVSKKTKPNILQVLIHISKKVENSLPSN